MAVLPIRPNEVRGKKQGVLPDAVLESFNELIVKKYDPNCKSAIVQQSDVVALMEQKGLSPQDIFDNGWLNIEDTYRFVGWVVKYEVVKYDKPGFNETYRATFTFQESKRLRV
jgi:hypothetical protein